MDDFVGELRDSCSGPAAAASSAVAGETAPSHATGTRTVAVLPGDGIGPEVVAVAVAVGRAALRDDPQAVRWLQLPFGAAARQDGGEVLPESTAQACAGADGVLLGAVDPDQRSASGEPCLLTLRRRLGVYARLRWLRPHPAVYHASPVRSDRLIDVDILFVRDLCGGIYSGSRTRAETSASDTCEYAVAEIERVVRRACELARERRRRLTLVDKANVLATSRLWRDTAERVVAEEFAEIAYERVLADAMAMELLRRPRAFDVIVTESMFGDILTDEAAMLVGSKGLVPSAAVGQGSQGLFAPIHGSAADIAGRGIANPYAAVLSLAMLLRLSLGRGDVAARIESAVDQALTDGVWTRDLGGTAATEDVTAALVERL